MGENRHPEPGRNRFFDSRLEKWCARANCQVSPLRLLGLSLLAGVIGGLVIWLFSGRYGLAICDAAIFATLPSIWLYRKACVRMRRFEAQLPQALEVVARALKAGHSLAAGLFVVSEEMPPPCRVEFQQVYEEQVLGIALEEALQSMSSRLDSQELRLFVASVEIQRKIGGDLAEILERVISVLRSRQQTLACARTIHSSLRKNAAVLAAMPLAALLLLWHIRPDAIERLWMPVDEIRVGLIALAAWAIGILMIVRVINPSS